MSFGEKLTKLRKEKGMSQEDLASNLNVSRQAVSKWESNNSYPETDKIVAICKLFNCSMDELIGLKNGPIKEKNSLLDKINEYFDKFVSGIKMFYQMTFTQKIKCLFEMGFYALCLCILFLITDTILVEVIRKLLYILPDELLYVLIQIFEGLYYLIYVVFVIYALIKLYKVRYLDCYENYLENEKKNETHNKEIVNEPKSTIKVKEEKIIIRDADSDFKPFNWLKKFIIFFSKFFVTIITVPIVISFVLLVAFLIFIIYFINEGIIIFYITLALLGCLTLAYVVIELFIKFIFSIKQNFKKLFIMFITALFVIGISGGLIGSEFTNYKILSHPVYNKLIYEEEIEYKDNLIIEFLKNYNTEVVIENRDNIKIEYYGTDKYLASLDTNFYNEYCTPNNNTEIKNYNIYDYYSYYDDINGVTINEVIKNILQIVQEKNIFVEEYYFGLKIKIYLPENIYKELNKNYQEKNTCNYYYDYNYKYYE